MADITYGSLEEFLGAEATYVETCEIDTNKYVVIYGDPIAGKAVVCTVSGTVVTVGTPVEFSTDIFLFEDFKVQLGVCKLDTDKFGIAFADDTVGDRLHVTVGTVSGTTITLGTKVDFGMRPYYLSCAPLGTDKMIINFDNRDAGSDPYGIAATISGTVPTPGASTATGITSQGLRTKTTQLGVDKFAFILSDAVQSDVYVQVGTVSGTTITFGTRVSIDPGSSTYMDIAKLDTDKFIAIYREFSTAELTTNICTVSGTTITKGTSQGTSAVLGPLYPRLAVVDPTSFIVVYWIGAVLSSLLNTLSGTTTTFGTPEAIAIGATAGKYSAATLIDTEEIAVATQATISTKKGITIAGTMGAVASSFIPSVKIL